MNNILIVCTANKTRSPMAMEIANKLAREKGAPYYFQCAGIAAIGNTLDENTAEVLKEIGIDSHHVPVHVSKYNIADFCQVHVMSERQKITLCSYYNDPGLADKIKVLNVEDPYYGGIEAYRQCRDKLMEYYKEFLS